MPEVIKTKSFQYVEKCWFPAQQLPFSVSRQSRTAIESRRSQLRNSAARNDSQIAEQTKKYDTAIKNVSSTDVPYTEGEYCTVNGQGIYFHGINGSRARLQGCFDSSRLLSENRLTCSACTVDGSPRDFTETLLILNNKGQNIHLVIHATGQPCSGPFTRNLTRREIDPSYTDDDELQDILEEHRKAMDELDRVAREADAEREQFDKKMAAEDAKYDEQLQEVREHAREVACFPEDTLVAVSYSKSQGLDSTPIFELEPGEPVLTYHGAQVGRVERDFKDNQVRGPEKHPDRKHGKEWHGHVGPVDHIPVNK